VIFGLQEGTIMPSDTDDPITVLKVQLHGGRGRSSYYLCLRSLAARKVADAAGSGDTVEDLGAEALPILTKGIDSQMGAEYGKETMHLIGVVKGASSEWLHWYPSCPSEPVPGSPGQAATRN
jgi:hypothetical protein